MPPKTYTWRCAWSLFALLMLTALINRVIDPFWYYRDVSIKGFNEKKPLAFRHEREFKPILLRETKPQAVIFGSSFLEIGFNPTHPAFTRNGVFRGYNFGMAGSPWERIFCNVIYAMENTDLKSVIIGVHPEAMGKPDCSGQLKDMGNVKPTTVLLSFAALKASYKTLILQNIKPTQTQEGMLFYRRDFGHELEKDFRHYINNRLAEYPTGKCSLADGYDGIPNWSYPETKTDIQGLEYLLQKLVLRQVEVKLVVYPVHALWLEMAMACGDILGRWHSVYHIAEVVDGINQAHNSSVELWDFQGVAGFFTEMIRNNQVKYWQDYGHFNYEMGDAMLDTLYHHNTTQADALGDDFGVVLTTKTVPERFNRFFKNRQIFLGKNPWFAHELARFTYP